MEARNTNNATVSDLVYSLLGLELKIDTQGQYSPQVSHTKIIGTRYPIFWAAVSEESKKVILDIVIKCCRAQQKNGTFDLINYFFSSELQEKRIDSSQIKEELEKILNSIYKKNTQLASSASNDNVQALIFNILFTIGKIIKNINRVYHQKDKEPAHKNTIVSIVALHLTFEYLATQWATSAVMLCESYYLYTKKVSASCGSSKRAKLTPAPAAPVLSTLPRSPAQPLEQPLFSAHDSPSSLPSPYQKKTQKNTNPKKRKAADIVEIELSTDEEESEKPVELNDFIEPKDNTADQWLDEVAGDQFLSIQFQIKNRQLKDAKKRGEQLQQGIQILELEKKADTHLMTTFERKFQDLVEKDSVLCKNSLSAVLHHAQTQHAFFQRKKREDEAKLEQYKNMQHCLEASYPENIPSPDGPSATPFTKMNLFSPHVDFNAEAIQSLEKGNFVYFEILVNNNQLTDPSLVFQSLDAKLTVLLKKSMDSIRESQREKLALSKLLTGLIVSPDTLKSNSQRLSEIKQDKPNTKKQINNYRKALKLLREKYPNLEEAAASFKPNHRSS